MKLDATATAELLAVTAEIRERVARDVDGVTETLRQAGTGELPMIESLTAAEAGYAQNMFAMIARIGPVAFLDSNLAGLTAQAEQVGDNGMDFKPMVIASRDIGSTLRPEEISENFRARLGLLLLSYMCYDEFRLPATPTGSHELPDVLEGAKWMYRQWFYQLEDAEPGTGLEEYFADQDLRFPQTDGSESNRVSLSCAGDLRAVDILVPETTPHLFDDIAAFYSSADIVSANLESVIDANQPVGRVENMNRGPRLNTSRAMFDRMVEDGGLTFISTATDHATDWGEAGVLATLDVLRDSTVRHTGTAASAAERDELVIVEHDGIKVALLAFTFGANGDALPADKQHLVNVVRFNDVDPDLTLIRTQVAAAKARGAEYIVAYCHWGWTFETYPHQNIVDVAHAVIDCGVDTILGNHACVAQPMERVQRAGRPAGLIVYSFGDFVSYHPDSRNSALALSVRFDIVRSDDHPQPHLANLRVLPLYIHHAEPSEGDFDCRILRFADVVADPDRYRLTEKEKDRLPYLDRDLLHGRLLPSVVPDGLIAD